VVAESAENGDLTAKAIIKEAARHLADLVHRTEEITGRENLAVKFAGGVAQISAVTNELQSLLGNRCTVASADIALEAARLAAARA
jgi:N-acetylglucosamine kinase-like BadF-type ATPase